MQFMSGVKLFRASDFSCSRADLDFLDPPMSLHKDAKIADQYEILNYIGQGTYANVCSVLLNILPFCYRCTRLATRRVGFMR